MASSKSGLLDRVSCGVCMEQYNNNTHVPKLLPCQHTFCQSCLTSIGAGTVDIICPECRKKHKVPRNGFTTIRAILDVVDEFTKDATTCVLMCAKHTIRESVSVYTDCLEGLCIKCVIARIQFTDDHHSHQLKELDEAKIQLQEMYQRQAKEKQQNLLKKLSLTRSTQRAQTSLVEADHYSHIAHCKNVEPWL